MHLPKLIAKTWTASQLIFIIVMSLRRSLPRREWRRVHKTQKVVHAPSAFPCDLDHACLDHCILLESELFKTCLQVRVSPSVLISYSCFQKNTASQIHSLRPCADCVCFCQFSWVSPNYPNNAALSSIMSVVGYFWDRLAISDATHHLW